MVATAAACGPRGCRPGRVEWRRPAARNPHRGRQHQRRGGGRGGSGVDRGRRRHLPARPGAGPPTGTVCVEVSGKRKAEALHVIELDDAALLEAMTKAARWMKFDGRTQEREVNAPKLAVEVYRGPRGALAVAGTNRRGHRANAAGRRVGAGPPRVRRSTGLFFDPCGLPSRPSRRADQGGRRGGLDKLKTSLRPSRSGASRTTPASAPTERALSALLTATIRRRLETAPLHGFTAPAAGTGKSNLRPRSVIATGREAGT